MLGPIIYTNTLACLDKGKNPIFDNRIFTYYMRQPPASHMNHLHVKYPGVCCQNERSTNNQNL